MERVEFKGTAKEYFGIWIVNIILTILTFGIYSAWAKVRTNRYFYGNTFIDGHSFEYHAQPMQILIGRIIVFGGLIVFNFSQLLSIYFTIALGVLFAIVMPFLIVKGLRFARQVTSYRNVRFNFAGTYWRAAFVIILLPIVNIFSFGLLTPYLTRALARFLGENTSYGGRFFTVHMELRPLYKVIVYSVFGGVGLFLVLVIFAVIIGLPSGDTYKAGYAAGQFYPFLLVALYIFAYQIYTAVARNTIYAGLTLDGRHKFKSTLVPFSYAGIIITNVLVTILTLGLMAPWAQIRLARYVADNTWIIPDGPLDDYASEIRAEGGVVGQEFMDVEGIDLGVAI